jgi:hypothetical protein
MTSLDRLEKAHETEFAYQEQLKFRIREKAIRMLAHWAAHQLGKEGQAGDAYAHEIVALDVANPQAEATVQRIAMDLMAKGIVLNAVQQAMKRFLAEAEIAAHGSNANEGR